MCFGCKGAGMAKGLGRIHSGGHVAPKLGGGSGSSTSSSRSSASYVGSPQTPSLAPLGPRAATSEPARTPCQAEREDWQSMHAEPGAKVPSQLRCESGGAWGGGRTAPGR
jgi:hypothetical protein